MSTVRLEPLFRVCPICTAGYQIFNSLQQTCGDIACKAEHRRQRELKRAARAERAKLRTWRQESKSIGKLKADAQRAVNRYVLARDHDKGCISCHMPANYGGQFHAGHYRTTAAAPQLRFDPEQIRKQCAQCNSMKSGNIIEFRKRLVAEIGAARVEAIENNSEIRRWTRDELLSIRAEFAAKRKELLAARGL